MSEREITEIAEINEIEALATRFFAAISAGDTDAIQSIYAPDARIWHNTDGLEQGVTDNLKVLRWVHRNLREWRYEEVRRHVFAGGFVQQHVARGIAPSGKEIELPACIVGLVEGGQITRIDEYIDSATVALMSA